MSFDRGATHSICNLRSNVPNKIPVVFHDRSNYYYHFIVKELANEFKEQFECLGQNTEMYKNFFCSYRKKVTKVDKEENENIITIFYMIKSFDSARFMASSLSNLVDNLTEGNHKITCKDSDCLLEYKSIKDDFIKYKCLSCNKDYSNKIDEELKKQFKNPFKFCNNDINNFILLLRKGVYPYEHVGELENFNEILSPEKDDFYSNLNMESITDSDYNHTKRFWYDFE